jgi:hypothetical protein
MNPTTAARYQNLTPDRTGLLGSPPVGQLGPYPSRLVVLNGGSND